MCSGGEPNPIKARCCCKIQLIIAEPFFSYGHVLARLVFTVLRYQVCHFPFLFSTLYSSCLKVYGIGVAQLSTLRLALDR